MVDTKSTGDLWGAEARDWADIQEPTSIPLWDAMLDATGTGTGTAFLDAGCAAGGASLRALARGADVTAVDIAVNSVDLAKSRLPDARVEVAGVGDLPFEDSSFGAVICVNVIQFVPNVEKGLADLVRVARPGGKVSVAVFGAPEQVDENVVFKAIVEVLGTPDAEFPEYRFSQPGTLQSLLSKAGLKDVVFAEINTPFDYADTDIGWRGQRSAGSIQEAMDKAGADEVEAAVKGAFEQFATPDGHIHMDNIMWYATGTK
ncbi:MAG: methyltransferase domain-containing protein [Pseudomonadota bacterium]